MTYNTHRKVADNGIRVNAVAPAVVLTTIYTSFIEEDEIPTELAGFNEFHPIGRIGQPEDVANAIAFLLSDKASWVTGTVMNVDGVLWLVITKLKERMRFGAAIIIVRIYW